MYQHLDLEMYYIPSVHPVHQDRILYRQEMLCSQLVHWSVLRKEAFMIRAPTN